MENGLRHKINNFKLAKIIFEVVYMIGNIISKCSWCHSHIELSKTLNLTDFFTQVPRHDISAPPWSRGSVMDHRSLPSVFESRRGHIRRVFRPI